MPFLPVVLLLAYQAFSRSARFALGWATALFFGQIPGNKGTKLAMISLASLAWVVLVVGAAIPVVVLLAADRFEMVSLDLGLSGWQMAGIIAASLFGPPLIAGYAELVTFDGTRSARRWLQRVPISYPVALSLGAGVLEMVLIAPFITLARRRRGQVILQVPLVIRDSESGASDVADAVCAALASAGQGEASRDEVRGPLAWPLRTIGFAARHLIGSVVRGDPQLLKVDGFEVIVYATNVAVIGAKEEVHRVRAAIHKHLALTGAFLTWSEDSQQLEAALCELHEQYGDDLDALLPRLDRLQDRIDRAELASDEWNLLYRLRLQVERAARLKRTGEDPQPTEPNASEDSPRPMAAARG